MSAITLLVDDPAWRKQPRLNARLKRAAGAAMETAGFKGKSTLTVLLSSDARLRQLNRDFRGRDKPTNVLSFPASNDRDDYRGDIAIAYGIARREAEAAGKRFADHVSHLVVHGVLHLAGYDHEAERDAKVMEPLEVKILQRLGIGNPYAEAKGSSGREPKATADRRAPGSSVKQGRARGFPGGAGGASETIGRVRARGRATQQT
ncbi:MAG TPA: rRNA maturation RNase YbeY [Rhizomicrobium sp.]|nr:rRNA maturation RNase YbeY [Rhizomicrobium sp.]